MNRAGFLKSILILAASPKVIAEMEFKPPLLMADSTKCLFSDLQLLTPHYYKSYIEKYGNVNYPTMMEIMGKAAKEGQTNEYFWFESRNK
jgi:hypothetical protein